MSLTYDKYHQCARVWLYGYSEARLPLTSDQALEKLALANPIPHLCLRLHLREPAAPPTPACNPRYLRTSRPTTR